MRFQGLGSRNTEADGVHAGKEGFENECLIPSESTISTPFITARQSESCVAESHQMWSISVHRRNLICMALEA